MGKRVASKSICQNNTKSIKIHVQFIYFKFGDVD